MLAFAPLADVRSSPTEYGRLEAVVHLLHILWIDVWTVLRAGREPDKEYESWESHRHLVGPWTLKLSFFTVA